MNPTSHAKGVRIGTVRESMLNRKVCLASLVLTFSSILAFSQSASTIRDATRILQQAMSAASAETRELVDRAHCVHVVPSAGDRFRASGPLVCRSGGTFRGRWGPPAMMNLSGGDLAEYDSSTSLIVLLMNSSHVDDIIAGREDRPSNAPGPDGLDNPPSVSEYERVDTVSYAFRAGELEGVELAGTHFGVDRSANEEAYGVGFDLANIVRGEGVEVPARARRLVDILQSASPSLRR